jgi:hypothetical protein
MSCAKSGYNTKNPAIFYIIKTESFVGYGISGKIKDRINRHKRAIEEAGLTILSIDKFSGSGIDILNLESDIKNTFPCNSQDIKGFVREATFISYYNELISFISNYMNVDRR